MAKKKDIKTTQSRLADLKQQITDSKPLDNFISDIQPTTTEIKDAFKTPVLNTKQLAFVDEYLLDLNATQAAIRAGYSKKTAGEQSYELLKKPRIMNEIKIRKQELAIQYGIKIENILEKIFYVLNLQEDLGPAMDFNVYHKYLDMLNKMSGFYAIENQINILNQTNNVPEEIKITIVQHNKKNKIE